MNKRKTHNFPDSEIKKISKRDVLNAKKHSLDSDEEDENDDELNVLDEDDIEGEEDGVADSKDGIRTTAFNMREEMEEGYFDKDGHFLWKKDKDIRDNWLDNIDWHQISSVQTGDKSKVPQSLGEESDEDDDADIVFKESECYKQILEYVKPNETIANALRRLGSNKKMSSVERLKLKKAGLLNANNENVTKLTELANKLLVNTGNMDIYQETYEQIVNKINEFDKTEKPPVKKDELDMYADDFEVKEKERLDDPGPSTEKTNDNNASNELMWEFKFSQHSENIEGPNTTQQMQKWVDEGRFKDGVWVRRRGQDQFYSSKRIDFELYLS